MFLRQYGLREYAITLTVAALVGLGIALLLNSAAGGAGSTGELTTKHELSVVSSAPPASSVTKPAKVASAAAAHPARKRVHRAGAHRASHPAPAPVSPQLVATRTPSPPSVPQRTSTPAPTPKPAPVVHQPAPTPQPAPAPKKRSGGGSGQFDDSG